jgi:hypothetical protein
MRHVRRRHAETASVDEAKKSQEQRNKVREILKSSPDLSLNNKKTNNKH